MIKKDFHNTLSNLRDKTYGDGNAKNLLYMFEVEANINEDFYNDLCNWLDKNKVSSTIFLRDVLADKFKDNFTPNDFFNAWSSLDTYIIQEREGR